MCCYFNVSITFDNDLIKRTIFDAISNKSVGYVCAVERNTMHQSQINETYKKIINSSLINICDGSFVAKVISWKYDGKFRPFPMPDLFLEFIHLKKYKQIFIGNTNEILSGLKNELKRIDPRPGIMKFQVLPFKDVNEFDYDAIGSMINKYSPDIIWVSLGAPKQEIFMNKLENHLEKGIMFGVGAAFNFYSGVKGQKRAPKIMRSLKLEWLHRIFQDPKKNLKRNISFLLLIPSLLFKFRK